MLSPLHPISPRSLRNQSLSGFRGSVAGFLANDRRSSVSILRVGVGVSGVWFRGRGFAFTEEDELFSKGLVVALQVKELRVPPLQVRLLPICNPL
jgi:hypothetical protein